MTIRVTRELKVLLGRLAYDTHRSRSYLAAEAVAAYVDRELDIIAGIHRGLGDAEAERMVPHDDAMHELYAVIAKASA